MKPFRKPSHKRTTLLPQFLFGCAYYPEHWEKEDREKDPALMKQLGFNAVRMAEFAWDLIEPSENNYDFDFFDKEIKRLAEAGVKSILCTPTATPPRWLTKKHPETLKIRHDDVVMQHGSRLHCCTTSSIFRKYSKKISNAFAKHYAKNKNVIGWQTDNEFNNCYLECYCSACQDGYVTFLKNKYNNDITTLNKAWGNSFWTLTFQDFESIPIPKRNCPGYENPSQMLDYYRFVSEGITTFQNDQVKILRKANPNWFIFHNGIFPHIDYRGDFMKDLDMLGYDIYPYFQADPDIRILSHSFNLDRARAWSGNFIIPEHQSGPCGVHSFCSETPLPGEIRKITYKSIAKGGDSLLYFRWRTCRFGAEQYFRGILDHDNQPKRLFYEIEKIGKELKVIGKEIMGTSIRVDIAIATSDFEVNDAHTIYNYSLPKPDTIAESIHGFYHKEGYAIGCVHPSDDLRDLDAYFIPHWPYFDPAHVKNLTNYVMNGGVLIIGAYSGTKNSNNNVIPDPPPGVLRELSGIEVQEYGKINNQNNRLYSLRIGKTQFNVDTWYESLECDGNTHVLGKWSNGHLKGQAAITRHPVGKGQVIYVGTFLDDQILTHITPVILKFSKLKKIIKSPTPGVEVICRENSRKKIWFLINHLDQKSTINDTPKGRDLITGKLVKNKLTLQPIDLAVIKQE